MQPQPVVNLRTSADGRDMQHFSEQEEATWGGQPVESVVSKML